MGLEFSIVIITKNEAKNIARCLQSLLECSSDIIVLDSNSTDNTVEIAMQFGAKAISVEWQGYGNTKNYGNQLAKHDWILSMDADEIVDEVLKRAIKSWIPKSENDVLVLNRYMVWNDKLLHFGNSREPKIRLFNRKNVQWNQQLVHEALEFKYKANKIIMPGKLLHYSFKSLQHAQESYVHYANLAAKQNFALSKKTFFWMPFVKYIVSFVTNYFIRLGFLDGAAGFAFAKEIAKYSFNKNAFLLQLLQNK
jgi:glycosyltransferase involved in cell wall biosynthesis